MRAAAVVLISVLLSVCAACRDARTEQVKVPADSLMVCQIVDPSRDSLRFFWKDSNGFRYGSLARLRSSLDTAGSVLRFAMNGGMYMPDGRPQGLYIENGRVLAKLDTAQGDGNFYMKPNGVFSVSYSRTARVVQTSDFVVSDSQCFATQSGPMLLIDGKMHPAFRKGSPNLNIRNGVGQMHDGRLLFAISKRPVNFYDFAEWFRQHGCRNALYLDGFVSRAFIPSADWEQLDGDFGVIVGVIERKR